jgi:AcrR family transcriptional regulator
VPTTSGLRERKKERTRAEIVSVAMRLFAQRGFDAVTVDEIGAEAEVSHRTFYRYFSCKEDVVLGDLRTAIAEMRDAFLRRPTSEPVIESIRAVILELAAGYDHDADSDAASDRQRVDLLLSTPALQHRRQERHVAFEGELVPLVAERLGVDPAVDMRPAVIAACAGAAMRVASDTWMARGLAGSLEPTVAEAFSMLVSGLH